MHKKVGLQTTLLVKKDTGLYTEGMRVGGHSNELSSTRGPRPMCTHQRLPACIFQKISEVIPWNKDNLCVVESASKCRVEGNYLSPCAGYRDRAWSLSGVIDSDNNPRKG